MAMEHHCEISCLADISIAVALSLTHTLPSAFNVPFRFCHWVQDLTPCTSDCMLKESWRE